MSNEIWLDLKCCWTKWNYLHWIRSALIRPYPMLNLPLEHLINLIRLLLACLGQSVAHVCQHGHPPETDTITKKQISYGKWQTATQPSRFDPGTIKLSHYCICKTNRLQPDVLSQSYAEQWLRLFLKSIEEVHVLKLSNIFALKLC